MAHFSREKRRSSTLGDRPRSAFRQGLVVILRTLGIRVSDHTHALREIGALRPVAESHDQGLLAACTTRGCVARTAGCLIMAAGLRDERPNIQQVSRTVPTDGRQDGGIRGCAGP